MDLNPVLDSRLAKKRSVELAVHVIDEHRPAIVPALHQQVRPAGNAQARQPGHGLTRTGGGR